MHQDWGREPSWMCSQFSVYSSVFPRVGTGPSCSLLHLMSRTMPEAWQVIHKYLLCEQMAFKSPFSQLKREDVQMCSPETRLKEICAGRLCWGLESLRKACCSSPATGFGSCRDLCRKWAVYVDGNGDLRVGNKQGEINVSHRDSNCNASAEHLLDGVWRFWQ